MIYCPVCREQLISRPHYVCDSCWQQRPEDCIGAIAVEREKQRQKLLNEASSPVYQSRDLVGYLQSLDSRQPSSPYDHYENGKKVLKKVGRELLGALELIITWVMVAITGLVFFPLFCMVYLIGLTAHAILEDSMQND